MIAKKFHFCFQVDIDQKIALEDYYNSLIS
jgi:hypothetical protein